MKSGNSIALSIAGIVVMGWYVGGRMRSGVEQVSVTQVAVTEVGAADRTVVTEITRSELTVIPRAHEVIAAKLPIVAELAVERLTIARDQVITTKGKPVVGAGLVTERLVFSKDPVVIAKDQPVVTVIPDNKIQSNPTTGAWIISKPGARDQKRKRQKQKAKSKRLGKRAGTVVALAKMGLDPDMKEPDNVNKEPKKVNGKFLGGFKEESWPVQYILYCAVICSPYIVAPNTTPEPVQDKRPVECTKTAVPAPAKLNVTEESAEKKLRELKEVVKGEVAVDVVMMAVCATEPEGSTKSFGVDFSFSPVVNDLTSDSNAEVTLNVNSAAPPVGMRMAFQSVGEVFRILQREGKASVNSALFIDNMECDSIFLYPSEEDLATISCEQFVSEIVISKTKPIVEYIAHNTGLTVFWDNKNGIGLFAESNGNITFVAAIHFDVEEKTILSIKANLLAAHKQYLATGTIPSDLGIEVLTPAVKKPCDLKPVANGTAICSPYIVAPKVELAQEKRPVECTKEAVPPPAKLNVTEESADKKLCELKEVVKAATTADVAMPPAGTPASEEPTRSPSADYSPGPSDMSGWCKR